MDHFCCRNKYFFYVWHLHHAAVYVYLFIWVTQLSHQLKEHFFLSLFSNQVLVDLLDPMRFLFRNHSFHCQTYSWKKDHSFVFMNPFTRPHWTKLEKKKKKIADVVRMKKSSVKSPKNSHGTCKCTIWADHEYLCDNSNSIDGTRKSRKQKKGTRKMHLSYDGGRKKTVPMMENG